MKTTRRPPRTAAVSLGAAALVLGALLAPPALGQNPARPVFIVAHRVNGENWIRPTAEQGVNAIEADFMYGYRLRDKYEGWFLAHDNVLTNSHKAVTWLAEFAEVAKTTNLSLLWVDIKTPNKPLDGLYDIIRTSLPNTYIVFDVGVTGEGKWLRPAQSRILHDPKAAIALGFSETNAVVDEWCKNNGYPIHKYWYEVGIFAGGVSPQWHYDCVRDAVKKRNQGIGPKVLYWTVEKGNTSAGWLREGVDALIVNSSKAYGRVGAGVDDADTHVAIAKGTTITGDPTVYPTKPVDLFLKPPPLPAPAPQNSAEYLNGANGRNAVIAYKYVGGKEAGYFVYHYNGDWFEKENGKADIKWRELGRDDWSVYLQAGDGSKQFLWLDFYQLSAKKGNEYPGSIDLPYKLGKVYAPTNIVGAKLSPKASLKKVPTLAAWVETDDNGAKHIWVEQYREHLAVTLRKGDEYYILDTVSNKVFTNTDRVSRTTVKYDKITTERGDPWSTPMTPK